MRQSVAAEAEAPRLEVDRRGSESALEPVTAVAQAQEVEDGIEAVLVVEVEADGIRLDTVEASLSTQLDSSPAEAVTDAQDREYCGTVSLCCCL
jgi:hypothetical protein